MEKNKKILKKEKIKKNTKNLKQETKKQTVTALVAALGFIIAFAWREALNEYIKIILEAFPFESTPSLIALSTAILTTIIAVIGLVLVNKWGQKTE